MHHKVEPKTIKATHLKDPSDVVVLQLPPAQLENALNRTPALKAPLLAHASLPEIRSSLPRFDPICSLRLLRQLKSVKLLFAFYIYIYIGVVKLQ